MYDPQIKCDPDIDPDLEWLDEPIMPRPLRWHDEHLSATLHDAIYGISVTLRDCEEWPDFFVTADEQDYWIKTYEQGRYRYIGNSVTPAGVGYQLLFNLDVVKHAIDRIDAEMREGKK